MGALRRNFNAGHDRRRWLERAVFPHFAPETTIRGGGQAADLDLDFMNDRSFLGPLGPSTCTNSMAWFRNSTSFYTTAQGTLVSFAPNVPRIGNRGMLVEGDSTNLQKQSQTIQDASWTMNAVTKVAANATAPDGTASADRIVDTVANTTHFLSGPTITFTPSTVYTVSTYIKYVDNKYYAMRLFDGSVAPFARFDIELGITATMDSGVTGRIEQLAGGWMRCQATFTSDVGAGAGGIQHYFINDDGTTSSYAGTGTRTIYIWGAQVEALSFASSYIPTTTVAVTRPSEGDATGTGTNGHLLNPTLIIAPNGPYTWYSDVLLLAGAGPYPNDPQIFELQAANRGNSAGANQLSPTGTLGAVGLTTGFSVSIDFAAGGITGHDVSQPGRLAARMTNTGVAGSSRISANGQAKNALDNTVWPTSPIIDMRIGSKPAEPMWGHIRRIALWNSALDNAALDQLSAGTPSWITPVENTVPDVDIDFTGKRIWYSNGEHAIEPTILCTRALGGYAKDTAGILHYFAADTPRITSMGLFHEKASTNLLAKSQDFSGTPYWSTDAEIIIPNTITAPDGTLTGNLILESTLNNNHFVRQEVVGLATSTVYNLSVFAKKLNRDYISLSPNGTTERTWFNIANGTVGTVNAGHTATIEAFTDGWYRCKLAFTETTATHDTFYIEINRSDAEGTYQGNSNNGVYLWGCQLELDYIATSYIPTDFVAVTRPIDFIRFQDTTLNTNFNPSVGSYYVDGTYAIAPSGNWNPRFVASGNEFLGTDPTGAIIQLYRPSLSYAAGGDIVSNGVKAACAFQPGARSIVGDGGTPATDTESYPLNENFSRHFLYVGNGEGGDPSTGFTRRVTYWRGKKFADATLTSITT